MTENITNKDTDHWDYINLTLDQNGHVGFAKIESPNVFHENNYEIISMKLSPIKEYLLRHGTLEKNNITRIAYSKGKNKSESIPEEYHKSVTSGLEEKGYSNIVFW